MLNSDLPDEGQISVGIELPEHVELSKELVSPQSESSGWESTTAPRVTTLRRLNNG